MATIHAKHLSILRSLVEAGCKDEKQIASLTIRDAVKLPRSCRIELASVLECMQNVIFRMPSVGNAMAFVCFRNAVHGILPVLLGTQ